MFQVDDLIYSDLCEFLRGYIKELLPDNRAIVKVLGPTSKATNDCQLGILA